MIKYLVGDATAPEGPGHRIIAHIVNDRGAWGAGFVMALSKRWTAPEESYRVWALAEERGEKTLRLGAVQYVSAERGITVANMCAQVLGGSEPPIRYDALARCLFDVAKAATILRASIHMPRIGCGLAGGSWDKVEPLIKAAFHDGPLAPRDPVPVYVYDLPLTRGG